PAAGALNNYIVIAKEKQSLTASRSSFPVQLEKATVQEESPGLKVQVYPNPNSVDNVHVALETHAGQEVVNIIMYNASGQIIKSNTLLTDTKGLGSIEIPVKDINRGFYIIRAQGISGNKQLRLLIE
ncbi:MAG: T9SS type A sorting domain-containing protein, partial [Ginsengibacter sp.]